MSVTLQGSTLRAWRESQGLTQSEMAKLLGTAREWLSRIENGKDPVSAKIQLRFDAIVREANLTPTVNEAGGGTTASLLKTPDTSHRQGPLGSSTGEVVASRFPEKRTPSTRADIEEYFRLYLDSAQAAAERDSDPDIYPSIMRKLKQQFRIEEFDSPPPPP